jgi:hypothetical protein
MSAVSSGISNGGRTPMMRALQRFASRESASDRPRIGAGAGPIAWLMSATGRAAHVVSAQNRAHRDARPERAAEVVVDGSAPVLPVASAISQS